MLYFTVRTMIELHPDIVPIKWLDSYTDFSGYGGELVDAILDVCGELPCIYRNPDELKKWVRIWFFKNLPVWKKLVKTTHYEYDPIANYDRKETVTDTSTIRSSGTNNSENNSIERVSAFNSDSMTDKQSGTFNGTTSGNMDVEKTDSRTVEIKGNIGVMTTQDMIKQEREISKFDVCYYVAEQFKERFCIMVY